MAAQDGEEAAEDYRPDLQVAGADKQLPNRARFVKPDEFVGDDVYEAPVEESEGSEEGPSEQLFWLEQTIREHALLRSGWGHWAPAPGEEIAPAPRQVEGLDTEPDQGPGPGGEELARPPHVGEALHE
ncbi:MAG: hypothetical protein ACOC5E_01245, partial [Acidobacteriota bacterium]